jgi:hypothetical protein
MRRKSKILATDHLRCLMDCRVKPGNDGQNAGAAIHMDGRYSTSCAGLTRASMMRRKSKILATDHLRCFAHDAQYRPIPRDVMAGLVPAIPIHVALPCPPKRDRRNKSGDDRRRRHATFTPAIHEASQAIRAARILHSRLIMDARVIGVRKHAVLRTAMPAHDARYQPIARDAGLVPAMTRYGQLQRGQTRVT